MIQVLISGFQILALKSLHDLSILHRDIKIDNIMFDDHGDLVLIDYGMVKYMGSNHDVDFNLHSGGVISTKPYAAPELRGYRGCHTTRSDIYALGVVILQLMLGQALPPTLFAPGNPTATWAENLGIPGVPDEDARDLLTKVCAHDPMISYTD